MARLVYGLLCDQVRVEAGTDKRMLIGVFDRFTVREFSDALQPFTIFGRLLVDEYEVETPIDFEVASEGVEPIAVLTGSVTVKHQGEDSESPYRGPNIYLTIAVQGLKVPSAGSYALEIKVASEKVGEIPFYVRQRKREGPTIVSTIEPQPPS